MEDLAGLTGVDLGPWGLVGIAVVLVLTGLLVPWRTHKRTLDQLDRVTGLLESAQDTNAANARSLKSIADERSLSAAVIEAQRALAARGDDKQEDR